VRFLKSANRTGAAIRAGLLLALALVAATAGFARADDYGPRGDVRELRFVAQRLLARTARAAKIDPAAIRVSDVVAVNNAALLSWDIGAGRGLMGLVRQYGRWWDAFGDRQEVDGWIDSASYPLTPKCAVVAHPGPVPQILETDGLPPDLINAALLHNSALRAKPAAASGVVIRGHRIASVVFVDRGCGHFESPVASIGGALWQIPSYIAGYDISVSYSANNAEGGTVFRPIYARAPTQAEIIPYPTTLRFLATSVLYFDLTIDSSKPVTFAPGTTIDIWFPFVLDETLNYDLTIGFAQQPIGPVYAKPFDNVLHYKLPGFTAMPGQTLMAEIDGNWP